MAQYWEDWAGQTVGSTAPTGWTKRWVTSGVTTTVVTDAAAPAGKSLRITKTASARSLISMDAVDSDPNRATVNIAMLVRSMADPSDGTSYTTTGVAVRASGNAASEQSYHTYFQKDSTQTRHALFNRYLAGVSINLSTGASKWEWSSLYWLHLSVSGSTVRARWATAADPTTYIWDSGDITNTEISAAGWVGIYSHNMIAQDILAVGVGTNGDTAPIETPTTTHELTASDLVVSSPVLGSPTLNTVSTVDALTASDLVVSSPVLGAPALAWPTLELVFAGDSLNLHPTNSTITGADTDTPTVVVAPRKTRINDEDGDRTQWWQFYGKITKALGKRPLFKLLFADYPSTIWSTWKPWYSYDNVTWQRFPSYTSNGLYKDFQLGTAFTGDDVWISFMPGYPVSRHGALIAELVATHADKLHQLPSANASHIIEMLPAQTNELGQTVPSQPFYGYGIWDADFDTRTPKRTVVLTNGVHPSEQTGDYVLEGFVRFLVSDDAKAVTLRQNYQFLIYPLLNPMGRYGGHFRGQWDQDAPYKNPNRDFGTDVDAFQLANSQALRDAVALDMVGRELACSFDCHGMLPDPTGKPGAVPWYSNDYDTTLHDAFMARLDAYDASYFGYLDAIYTNTVTVFFRREYEPLHGYTIESYMQHAAPTGVDTWRVVGEHFAKTVADSLEDMRADGAYPLYKTDELMATSLVVGSPVLGTPALGQIHVLGSDGLVTGSPVLGSPSITQIHTLEALGLTVGVPVLGTPALNGSDIVLIAANEIGRGAVLQARNYTATLAARNYTARL